MRITFLIRQLPVRQLLHSIWLGLGLSNDRVPFFLQNGLCTIERFSFCKVRSNETRYVTVQRAHSNTLAQITREPCPAACFLSDILTILATLLTSLQFAPPTLPPPSPPNIHCTTHPHPTFTAQHITTHSLSKPTSTQTTSRATPPAPHA